MRFGEDITKLHGNLAETPASPERLNPKFRRGRTADVIQKQKTMAAKKFQMELEEMRNQIEGKETKHLHNRVHDCDLHDDVSEFKVIATPMYRMVTRNKREYIQKMMGEIDKEDK